MKSRIKTLLLVCMAVLGLAVLFPSQSAQAATTSAARQVRVDASSNKVTIDFKSFSSKSYTYTLTTPSNTTKTIKPTVTTSDGAVHAQFSISGYEAGLYSVTVKATDSTKDEFTIGFYNYSGITSTAFTWSTRTLTWKDGGASIAGPVGTTPKYQIAVYTSEAKITVPGAATKKVYGASGTSSKVLPTSIGTGTYYVVVTPYFETSTNANYYGPSKTLKVNLVTKPTGLKVTQGYKSLTISWTKVSGATSYVLKNRTTGKSYTIASTKTSYTNSSLTEGTSYKYELYTKNGKSTSAPASITGTVPTTTKSKVSNLTVAKASSSSIKVSWSKAADTTDVDGYNVYYKKSSATSYSSLGSTTGTSLTSSKSFSNTNYVFMVKPYTKIGSKKVDTNASAVTYTCNPYSLMKGSTTTSTSVRTMGFYSKTNKSAPIYNTATSTKVVKTLAKGTKVEQVGPPNATTSKCRIKYNGKYYYIKRGAITSYGENYNSSKRYSKAVKENYVNVTKNLKSSTKYLIWISHYTQQVTIFTGSQGNWKVLKSMDTATGKHSTRSPLGVKKTTYKEKGWYYINTYEDYVTHWSGRNSFHTRVHTYGGGYADATIKKPASHGCARLYDSDAKWIYDNIPSGTTVLSW